MFVLFISKHIQVSIYIILKSHIHKIVECVYIEIVWFTFTTMFSFLHFILHTPVIVLRLIGNEQYLLPKLNCKMVLSASLFNHSEPFSFHPLTIQTLIHLVI